MKAINWILKVIPEKEVQDYSIFNDILIHNKFIRFCLHNVDDRNLNILNFNRTKDNNCSSRVFQICFKMFFFKIAISQNQYWFQYKAWVNIFHKHK
jgi:hypothetical protein